MALRTAAAFTVLAVGVSKDVEIESAFKDFVAKYDKKYRSQDDEDNRFTIFENNFKHMKAENAKSRGYTLVVNAFADQENDEFKSTHFGLSAPPVKKLWLGAPHLGTDEYSGAPLPAMVDWTSGLDPAVTLVKDQGACGACWAYSSTGAMEGAWKIKTGKLVSMSEQQLLDCNGDTNSGCQGGDMDTATDFLMKHSLCTEASYQYKAKVGTCQESTCTVAIPQGDIVGYFDVPVDNTSALMEAVAQQPVSIAIEADQHAFQMYGGGILTGTCGTSVDHGVLLVGYGTENGTEYWKVKNSWGPSWGDSGYVRIERGVKGDGKCGIKSRASYPKVATTEPVPTATPTAAPTAAPTATPTAAPKPEPSSCEDANEFCGDTIVFKPEADCLVIPGACQKTCGCCGETPKSWCNGVNKDTVIV